MLYMTASFHKYTKFVNKYKYISDINTSPFNNITEMFYSNRNSETDILLTAIFKPLL